MAPGKGKTASLRKKQEQRKKGKRRIDDELSQMRNPYAGRSLPGVWLSGEPAHKKIIKERKNEIPLHGKIQWGSQIPA